MVTVIRPGHFKTIECSECGALLRYDETCDVKLETSHIFVGFASAPMDCSGIRKFITCPQCEHQNILTNGDKEALDYSL